MEESLAIRLRGVVKRYGAITAVEQFYTENANTYPAGSTGGVSPANLVLTGTPSQTVNVSPGNTITYTIKVTVPVSYVLCGQNKDGLTIYVYNSATGGSVGKSTQTTMALCASTGT